MMARPIAISQFLKNEGSHQALTEESSTSNDAFAFELNHARTLLIARPKNDYVIKPVQSSSNKFARTVMEVKSPSLKHDDVIHLAGTAAPITSTASSRVALASELEDEPKIVRPQSKYSDTVLGSEAMPEKTEEPNPQRKMMDVEKIGVEKKRSAIPIARHMLVSPKLEKSAGVTSADEGSFLIATHDSSSQQPISLSQGNHLGAVVERDGVLQVQSKDSKILVGGEIERVCNSVATKSEKKDQIDLSDERSLDAARFEDTSAEQAAGDSIVGIIKKHAELGNLFFTKEIEVSSPIAESTSSSISFASIPHIPLNLPRVLTPLSVTSTTTSMNASMTAKAVDGDMIMDLPHSTLQAGAEAIEIGVASGSHGWLKIRAEMTSDGEVSASLGGGSHAIADSLRENLPALTSFLQQEHVQVSAIAVHVTPSVPPGGESSQKGWDDSTGNNAAAGGQAQQELGQRSHSENSDMSKSNKIELDDVSDVVYGNRIELGVDSDLTSIEYGDSGGWLNVRA